MLYIRAYQITVYASEYFNPPSH